MIYVGIVIGILAGIAIFSWKLTQSKPNFFAEEYEANPETISAIEELKEKLVKGEISEKEFDKKTKETIANDPTWKNKRGVQSKNNDGQIDGENIPSGIKLTREVGSLFGITICKKCGARTKMKHTGPILDKLGDEWAGYAICPKCGTKERWLSGSFGP